MPIYQIGSMVGGKTNNRSVEADNLASVQAMLALENGYHEIWEAADDGTGNPVTGGVAVAVLPAQNKSILFKLKEDTQKRTGFIGLNFIDPAKSENDIIPLLQAFDVSDIAAVKPDTISVSKYSNKAV